MGVADFFKNVGTSIGKTVGKTADKIDDAVDVQKIKYKISKKQDEITYLQTELGKKMLAVYAETGEADIASIEKTYSEICRIKEEIEALNAVKAEKRGDKICPGCSAVISKDDEYCSKCGMKVSCETKSQGQEQGASDENGNSQDDGTYRCGDDKTE